MVIAINPLLAPKQVTLPCEVSMVRGAAGCCRKVLSINVHPCASVTVSKYSPALSVVRLPPTKFGLNVPVESELQL